MARVRCYERFVEHQRGLLETRLEIAKRPGRIGRLPHRHPAFFRVCELFFRPFQILDLRKRRWLTGRRSWTHPDIAFDSRSLCAGPQRLERIDMERQRLPADL